MEVVLRKYGNSTVVVLPPTVLRDLGLSAGQAMTLEKTEQNAIILARKPKFNVAEMIAQCDPKAPMPADLALWDSAKPVGQEVW
jgi:antitoxin ChpS